MKSNNVLIGLSILFFVLAVAFALVFRADVSLVAKIDLFVLGFGSGVTAGQWSARRSAKAPPCSHRHVTEAVGRSLAAQQLAEADPVGWRIGWGAWPASLCDNR